MVTHRPPYGWKPGDPKPREPTPVLEVKAEKNRLEEAIRSGRRSEVVTVRTFLDARKDLCQATGSKNSEGAFKVFDHFADWCEAKGIETVDRVTPTLCDDWFRARSREISPKTKKPRSYNAMARDRGLLSAAWNRAIRLGTLQSNPWTAIDVPAKPHAPKRGSWSPEELETLLAVCNPWLRNILIVGTNTGLRINALINIEWRDIRLGGPGLGELYVRKELDKGGRGYTVPLSKKCHDLLVSLPRRAPTVIVGMKGRPLKCQDTVAMAIERACNRAGLPVATSHFMRRTFGRWAILGHLTGRPVPLYVVSRWMGHSNTRITETYLNITETEDHEWMSSNMTPPLPRDDPAD
jgi:integrase